jgi:hypothetical protein
MNASILTQTNNASAIRPNAPCERLQTMTAPRYAAKQLRKQEADRAFEAGVQWFLEVSRKA